MACSIEILNRLNRVFSTWLIFSSENILLTGDRVKLADYGSVAISSLLKDKEHTEYVSTRWYRSPECLLTKGVYDYKVYKPFYTYSKIPKDGHLGRRLRNVRNP